jgi:hypothetical protein
MSEHLQPGLQVPKLRLHLPVGVEVALASGLSVTAHREGFPNDQGVQVESILGQALAVLLVASAAPPMPGRAGHFRQNNQL